ncbi:hypothetical protein HMPREF3206_00996 [Fusobacterium equinum]|uniref:Uncharacterized protein n=1 Tax=Fusobacterium equinum TaxID=134605 RepID=A0A133NDR7_9FUSO|nr:hypothetical protein [Fusobacterium equinum]KXA14435.1 hypothetical protein HMPREF3206_00996 [Fusobacterium equinum]
MKHDLRERILKNKEFNRLLMHECDIRFYEEVQEVQFSENHERYSISCKAFAQDASGGEFVFLEDDSIGLISSEGDVGRIAESLEEFLTFLIHVGNIFDFSCKHLYKNQDLLNAYCNGYLSKIREEYRRKNKNWDDIRSSIAKKLSLPFLPNKLAEFAMNFYHSATREPVFSCKFLDEGEEIICDDILSDNIGIWILETSGMTKEEFESYKSKD